MSGSIKKDCLYCSVVFYTCKSQTKIGAGKYCSKSCYMTHRKKTRNIKLICRYCSKEYSKKISLKHSKYCSRKCKNLATRTFVKTICNNCNCEFERPRKNYWGKNTYCSSDCYAEFRNKKYVDDTAIEEKLINGILYIEFICDYCGDNTNQKKANFNIKGNHHFCNKKCEGHWRSINVRGDMCGAWKGGITDLRYGIRTSRDYKLWRTACFKRENYICELCDQHGGYLEVHHLKSFADIIDEFKVTSLEEAKICHELWDIDNGQVLCKECHNNITFKVGE
ncbi:hypothetical protein HN682_01770 [Candidatus Peregrinibacteria bacterium]|jgi:hypothetical protein|nr:hypothetical protein [Candidatus Peregrinibacteria bacterium]